MSRVRCRASIWDSTRVSSSRRRPASHGVRSVSSVMHGRTSLIVVLFSPAASSDWISVTRSTAVAG